MSDAPAPYQTPYTPTPGSSTPSPHITPEEGRSDLKLFALLAVLNTTIIGVAGVVAWWFATGH